MKPWTQSAARPTFSIVLPTRDRPDTFARALASVERQTFRDFELVVVDDCSAVPYAEPMCRELAFPCVVIRNKANLRPSGARNVGIRQARASFISFLDDDDELHDTFLAATHHCFQSAGPEVGLSWSSVRWLNYSSRNTDPPELCERSFPHAFVDDVERFEHMMSIGTGFGVTIRQSCLERIGAFDESLCAVEDADLFLRLLSHGILPVVVPGVQVTIHNHHSERLTSDSNHRIRIEECRLLIRRYKTFLERYPSLRRQLEFHIENLSAQLKAPKAHPSTEVTL